MSDVEDYEDFIASRRSGRRNAIHDIPGGEKLPGPAELSQSLAQLNINKSGDEKEDSENSHHSPAKEEEAQSEES